MASFSSISVWRWWVGELSSLLPDTLKSALWGYPTAKPLTFVSDQAQVQIKSGEVLAPLELLDFVNNTDIGTTPRRPQNIDLVWPSERCLVRTLSLPKASLGQHRKMLRLDLLQSTPFSDGDVFWCFETGATVAGKTMLVQYVVKRADIQKFSNCALGYGLRVRRVFLNRKSNATLVLDNAAQISAPAKLWRRANAIMAVAIIGLGGALVYLPHSERSHALNESNTRVIELSQRALELRRELDAAQAVDAEKAAFLSGLNSRPVLIANIFELTHRLPDEVWLQHLSLQASKVVISGIIDGSAAELVLALNQSPMIDNPRLSGAVSKTGSGNQERFEITFEIAVAAP